MRLAACVMSPGSTTRSSTTAAAGARISVCAKRACATSTAASASINCWRACCASAPDVLCAATCDLDAASWLRATCTCRSDSSTRDWLIKPFSASSCERFHSRSAISTFDSACDCDSCAVGNASFVTDSMRARARSRTARACLSAAVSSGCSSCTNSWPSATRAPSRTATRCTRPVMVAPMSTRAGASTRPLATTLVCTSSRLAITTSTSVGLARTANQAAPATNSTTSAIHHQRQPDSIAYPNHQ